MKNKKNKLTSLLTVLLAVLGVCMLLVGGIGGARAALTESDDYTAEMKTPTIAIQLYENDTKVTDGSVLKELKEEPLLLGKAYKEELTVTNTGTADAFVRITLYKYWTDSKGKRVDLDPDYIDLVFGSDWKEDTAASTEERTVLYYTKALKPGDKSGAALTKIAASSELSMLVVQTSKTTEDEDGGKHTTITSTYKYDGLNMNLEASVDAIQVHNGQDAIKAAWGVTNVTADEAGTLTVK